MFLPGLPRGEAVRALARALAESGAPEPALDARLLAAAALRVSSAALLAEARTPLGPDDARRLSALAARRLAREPVARILGSREFWGLPFALGPDTLEPRPDTETLVEAALARIADRAAPLRLLDLGTGSGCLLVALLHELPSAWGVGIDRSPSALAVARANARVNGVGGRACFMAGHWAAPVRGRFDLVVANPPYVESATIADLAPEVARHDPRLALDGGPDGLAAYRAIFADLRALLRPGGFAVIEAGRGQAPSLLEMAGANGLRVAGVQRDLAGIERALLLD